MSFEKQKKRSLLFHFAGQTCGIARLCHETFDVSVEEATIVVVAGTQREEILKKETTPHRQERE